MTIGPLVELKPFTSIHQKFVFELLLSNLELHVAINFIGYLPTMKLPLDDCKCTMPPHAWFVAGIRRTRSKCTHLAAIKRQLEKSREYHNHKPQSNIQLYHFS